MIDVIQPAVADDADDADAALPVGVIRLDAALVVQSVNRAAGALCGCAYGHRVRGLNVGDVFGPEVIAALTPYVAGAVGGEGRRGIAKLGRGVDVRDVLVAFVPRYDESGRCDGVVGTLTESVVDGTNGDGAAAIDPPTDVAQPPAWSSSPGGREERRRRFRLEAEAAARAREQFLSIVSHELRSPLNGIQSWSHVLENQLLGNDDVNPLVRRALAGIRAGVEQQVGLIEHLLDASLALTGDLRMSLGPMVMREPIEAAVADMRATAIEKDVALNVDMRFTDESMVGDAARIRQLCHHLLSNAVKFTPRGGGIWLSAKPDGGSASLVIRDSGRGLPAGYEAWMFKAFGQADSSNTRGSGGIGLGLALASRIVDAHGGRIRADSAGPHLGTTFTVSLPLQGQPALHAASPSHGAPPTHLAGVDALVVDDEAEAREALSALLVQFGARVRLAASSSAAIDLIERGDVPTDVVICDIAMPDEDGYGFVGRLRAGEAAHAGDGDGTPVRIPVIALSAFHESAQRSASAGGTFDYFLAKPVRPDELLSTLAAATRGLVRRR